MTASQVIIGIHGLANKPEAETLEGWWKDAILEGLERNQGRTSKALGFDSVYWADVMYAAPIPDEDNKEPYVKAEGPLKLAKRYFGFDEIADAVLRAKLDDLATYYQKPTIRTELRGRLRKALDDHDGKRIMVIAHSMGSIIAYDVLRALGREDPARVVEHFVTIGSPLGLPHVKHKIYQENDLVRTPSVVRRWTNFADRRDPVAADVHLAGDYEPNNRGVTVRDDLVINGYKSPAGKANHHKSYGYLRAPEISAAIRSFF
jgi:pimeloyl-ACP methyl ester carboxylesterase